MSGFRARRRRLLLAPLLVIATAGAPASADGATSEVLKLRPRQSAFWNSAAPSRSGLAPQPCPVDRCYDWRIATAAGGDELRVAVTAPGNQGSHTIQLYDGAGTLRKSGSSTFSKELRVPAGGAQTWVLRVYTSSGRTPAFRVRAMLAVNPVPPARARALLPNLRLIPPYQFTFGGTTLVGGTPVTGCNGYEHAEYGARRCLRFSLGPENTGDGPLELRFSPINGVTAQGQVFQIVRRSDDTQTERLAGSFEYHKTHLHYHHSGFGSLELLRVTDPARGRMVRAGTGPKQGFCMLDFLIAEWRSFGQDVQDSTRQDCGIVEAPDGVYLGLTRGWGDIYHWSLDGNYVEFGVNGDGYYVVRSTADALRQVLETNERDNTGYAYIQVTGDSVRVIERGRGTSPWDPKKRIADDLLPSNV